MATGEIAFGDLQALIRSIGRYLDIDPDDANDPTAQAIPGFVRLGEATIGRRLRCVENLARAIADLDYPEELLPSDFGSMRSVMVGPPGGPYQTLAYLRPDQFESVHDCGTFGLYTMYAGKIILQPSSTDFYLANPYQIRLVYFNRPILRDLAATNAVLQYHPDIYLYASLVAASTFVVDAQRGAAWTQLYDACLQGANDAYDESHTTLSLVGLETGP